MKLTWDEIDYILHLIENEINELRPRLTNDEIEWRKALWRKILDMHKENKEVRGK